MALRVLGKDLDGVEKAEIWFVLDRDELDSGLKLRATSFTQ